MAGARQMEESATWRSLYVSDEAFRAKCLEAYASDSFRLKAELRSQVDAWAEVHQVD